MTLLLLALACGVPPDTGPTPHHHHTVPPADTGCEDADGDGACAFADCDDHDPLVFPGTADTCDGVDNDCDGTVDEGLDQDGDGVSTCAGDCDDFDGTNAPTLAEICDHHDNDCDGDVDEGFDADGDGQKTCEGDCDDADPEVFTGQPEACDDGKDDDCDPTTSDLGDDDGDGVTLCDGDCDDHDPTAYPGADDGCDGVDNDCNGVVDEHPACWACNATDPWLDCTTAMTWTMAEALCEAWGEHLVVIDDQDENDAVSTLAWAETGGYTSWIGFTDATVEGTFLWVDGSTSTYTSWNSGEPNDYAGEDCGSTNAGALGGWNDAACNTLYPFVCEE